MVPVLAMVEAKVDTLARLVVAILEITVEEQVPAATTGDPLVLQPVEPLLRDGRVLSFKNNPLSRLSPQQ